ncbi:MAG: FadR family transcriptional regulator [Firmicutes bacterium]|nr:FadR family transcriptional regulator [Bacillota bacterium]
MSAGQERSTGGVPLRSENVLRSEQAVPSQRPLRGRKPRLYENVIVRIKELIAQGQLAPGDKLPSEKELCETLGVSRTAVREAMSALQAQGLVEVRHGSGVTIRRLDRTDLVEPLSLLLLTSQENLAQLLELRRAIEGEAAFLAAKRASTTDLGALTAAFQAMENEVRKGGSGANHDYDFHYAVARASQNDLFVKLLMVMADIFRAGLKQTAREATTSPAGSMAALEQHRSIWKAILERNGDTARAAMRSHLGNVSALVRSNSSREGGGEGKLRL